MDFEHAFKAHIPIIGVKTDDIVNFTASLQLLTGETPAPWSESKTAQAGPYKLYYTDKLDHVTVENYRFLAKSNKQLIVLNPDKPSSLIFDGGILPTPTKLLAHYLQSFVHPDLIDDLLEVLKGLSLKTASEVMQLTMARTGNYLPAEVKRTRIMLGGTAHGLNTVDTAQDFYEAPPALETWLKVNGPYFLNPKTPRKLRPRGVLFAGVPGVGKTEGAKKVANHFGLPLYRMDIATMIDRFQGMTENRVFSALRTVERESPCILLLDEVEKIFTTNELTDTGVIARVLSQLLWWLAEHDSPIITVMTTNKMGIIPPELYRPGRMDLVIKIQPLGIAEAKQFAVAVFKSVMGKPPTMKQQNTLRGAIDALEKAQLAHSEIAGLVYEQIKEHQWYPLETA